MKALLIITLLISINLITLKSQDDGLQKSNQSQRSATLIYKDIDSKITKSISIFFDNLIKKEVDKGFDQLLKNSLIANRKEEVKNLKEQTKRSYDIYGDILSFEFVSGEIVSDSFVRLRYLSLHSNYPMRWVFTYYKSPDKGWLVTNIKFDDASENYFTD